MIEYNVSEVRIENSTTPIYDVLMSCRRSSYTPWYKTEMSRTDENYGKPCWVWKKKEWIPLLMTEHLISAISFCRFLSITVMLPRQPLSYTSNPADFQTTSFRFLQLNMVKLLSALMLLETDLIEYISGLDRCVWAVIISYSKALNCIIKSFNVLISLFTEKRH